VALSVVEYSAPEKREQNKESSFSKGNRKECVDYMYCALRREEICTCTGETARGFYGLDTGNAFAAVNARASAERERQ
jgi:hypothetical protein